MGAHSEFRVLGHGNALETPYLPFFNPTGMITCSISDFLSRIAGSSRVPGTRTRTGFLGMGTPSNPA